MRPPRVAQLFTILAASLASGQSAGEVIPDAPRRGEELVFYYDAGAPSAALRADEGIHGVALFQTERGLRALSVELAPGDDGELEGAVAVPDDAIYVYAEFVTRGDHDRDAGAQRMIHDAVGEPVRGARIPRVYFDDDRRWLEEELERFPESHGAYRAKWFLASMDARQDHSELVRTDLERIGDARHADALWARSFGHLLLGEEEAARGLLVELLERHPESVAAARGWSDYDYQCYARSLTAGRVEVLALVGRAIADHPTSPLAVENVRVVSNESSFTLEETRGICEAWHEEAPLDPEPLMILARKHLATGRDLDEGARLITRALNGYLRGDARLSGDTHGTMTRIFLPSAYRTACELARAREDVASAIAYARAAAGCETQTDARAFELEAELWESMGQRAFAETAWTHALDAGSLRASAELERLSGGEPVASEAAARELPLAPTFELDDLEGRELRLEDLRGNVVVLNFWGLGCAPCKVEIPDLNELVRSFEGRPVHFVALAGDRNEDVRAYLDEHEFLYRNAAQAGAVIGAYRVTSFPTHVVIDPDGRVAASLTGAGKDQTRRIAALVERALQ